ncbi:MAG TPA: cation transporter [Gemmatimonadales bacterium]|nr:cation transporter [Gemmatimonadales bacterium]
MKDATIHIEGMSCGHCLNAVNQALGQAPGVEVGSVQMGRATVRYDETVTDPARIAGAIEDAGYRATVTPAA